MKVWVKVYNQKCWTGGIEKAICYDSKVVKVDRDHNNRLIGLSDKNLSGLWQLSKSYMVER